MPQGLFLQGMVVLFRTVPSVDAVTAALRPLGEVRRRPADGEKNWISGYEGWLVPFRPEVNGTAVVEVIDAAVAGPHGQPDGRVAGQVFVRRVEHGVHDAGRVAGHAGDRAVHGGLARRRRGVEGGPARAGTRRSCACC